MKKRAIQKTNITAGTQKKGKYPSMEAASLAKMESAKDFIANVDMSFSRRMAPLNR